MATSAYSDNLPSIWHWMSTVVKPNSWFHMTQWFSLDFRLRLHVTVWFTFICSSLVADYQPECIVWSFLLASGAHPVNHGEIFGHFYNEQVTRKYWHVHCHWFYKRNHYV